MAGSFIEQIKRKQEASQAPPPPPPAEEMSPEELEEAVTAARRKLLDAQHAELREREIARVTGSTPTSVPETTLADVLREKQRGKRRAWR